MKRTRPIRARARALAAAALLLLSFAAPSGAQQPGLPAEKIRQIEQLITSAMARQSIAGLSVAVVTDNQLRWSNGYGFADLENFVPAKSATVYRLGSLSKPVTAAAVMQLAEQGKLDLDAPVQKYCPAFPQKQWTVTARQILGHLSGIRHYKSDEEFNSTRYYPSVVEGLALFKDDPLLFEPGTKYLYSTFGYSVLGCAVEGASGERFGDYVAAHVIKPGGMDHMRVDSIPDLIPNRAQGYRRAPDGTLRNSPLADNSYKVPGGGFVSTAEDLAKFYVAMQTGKLLKRETVEQMWTRQHLRDGKETEYGLGWGIVTANGLRYVGHSGAQQRISTTLQSVPERGVAVAIMVNVEDIRLAPLANQIIDVLLK
ncbi:MAG: beta-lactamase family protein [Acidobacteria bacterium]|nr:beta-lactamase family protein [Acidobacteriota bacterium]